MDFCMYAAVSQVFPGFELLGWYTVGAKVLPTDLATHRSVRFHAFIEFVRTLFLCAL